MIFRRRRVPPELEAPHAAFLDVLAEVETAKEALTDLPGRPLPDALIEYESHVERAAALMPGWRCGATEQVWQGCASGLDDALALARRLREEAPDLGGFEGLLGTVESLFDPLQPFEDAAKRFDALKV